MDTSLSYDRGRYDFTEETWRTIFAFESKLKSHKLFKKVFFKEGELESCISWVRNVLKRPQLKSVISNCSNYKESRLSSDRLFVAKYKLAYSFKKNKYVISKNKKDGLRYSFEDVAKFLAVLEEAEKYDNLFNFLSIPDVWYIIRNVRDNWEEFTEQI